MTRHANTEEIKNETANGIDELTSVLRTFFPPKIGDRLRIEYADANGKKSSIMMKRIRESEATPTAKITHGCKTRDNIASADELRPLIRMLLQSSIPFLLQTGAGNFEKEMFVKIFIEK